MVAGIGRYERRSSDGRTDIREGVCSFEVRCSVDHKGRPGSAGKHIAREKVREAVPIQVSQRTGSCNNRTDGREGKDQWKVHYTVASGHAGPPVDYAQRSCAEGVLLGDQCNVVEPIAVEVEDALSTG